MIPLLILLAIAPMEIPEGKELPPWPLWACESYEELEVTVCRVNTEVLR